MSETGKRLMVVMAFVAGTAGGPAAHAEASGAEFEAALVPCTAVTTPAALAGCGADTLTKGEVHISKRGDVGVAIQGAPVSTTYDVVYRSFDGGTDLAIGALATNGSGSGSLEMKGFFALNDTGAGTIVLKRGGLDQFFNGFDLAAAEPEGLEAGLVRCADVTKSAPLSNCGSDPLGGGKAEVEEEGKLEVKVSNAAPSATYSVNFRSADGATEIVGLGTFITDAAGKGGVEIDNAFAAGAIGAGNVVLKRSGDPNDQFMTGFRVSERPKIKAEETRFRVSLVRCVEVTQPVLGTCGIDNLFKGFAELNEKGGVKVVLVRAEPQQAYDVFFRALDGTETQVGTLTTNPAGNVNFQAKSFFNVNDVISGNVVVKRGGFDQFVTGVKVIK
jgi:hypothetical protein